MPLSRSRDYLSIGEVLDAVRSDFPDVSISKIRFLESEGLLQPERTASGYRKFYVGDVQRLRYILSLQRDQFLPLKVIKQRLSQAGSNGGAGGPALAPAGGPDPAGAASGVPPDQGSVSLTLEELRASAGLGEEEVRGLMDFGILERDADSFDGADLQAARAAAGLFRYGFEARHLKMYRLFAEREAALVEQITSPVRSRRDPDAQKEAEATVEDLVALTQQFRNALMRASLRRAL